MDLIFVNGKIEHILNRQALKLRNIDVLDLVLLDSSPLVGCEITEMEDGDGLIRRQVDLDL